MWGLNSNGQLADNTVTARNSPVLTTPLPQRNSLGQIGTSSWTIVSASGNTSAAITTTKTLFMWGDNTNNQLGDYTSSAKGYPIQVKPLSWTKISKGWGFTGAIRSDGALFMWGFNTTGQLGDGTAVSRSSPVQVGAVGDSWTNVGCGASYTVTMVHCGRGVQMVTDS
jgi:alpha-tubulin suppressor-like RCC1 family protein